jgi:hypothetical protein
MASVGKSDKTYEYYRKRDPEFKREIESIRSRIAAGGVRREVPDFPEFQKQYLHQEAFPHQL